MLVSVLIIFVNIFSCQLGMTMLGPQISHSGGREHASAARPGQACSAEELSKQTMDDFRGQPWDLLFHKDFLTRLKNEEERSSPGSTRAQRIHAYIFTLTRAIKAWLRLTDKQRRDEREASVKNVMSCLPGSLTQGGAVREYKTVVDVLKCTFPDLKGSNIEELDQSEKLVADVLVDEERRRVEEDSEHEQATGYCEAVAEFVDAVLGDITKSRLFAILKSKSFGQCHQFPSWLAKVKRRLLRLSFGHHITCLI